MTHVVRPPMFKYDLYGHPTSTNEGRIFIGEFSTVERLKLACNVDSASMAHGRLDHYTMVRCLVPAWR